MKAIVIGASSGIGKELSFILANNGYKVGLMARRTDLLQEMVDSNNDVFIAQTCDITQTETIQPNLEKLIEQLGGLDLLIMSSGTGELNATLDYNIEKATIELNVSAFTQIMDFAYNYFIKQKEGHIVAITSVMGLRGSGAAPAYSATKAYQVNYLESLKQRANAEKKKIHISDIRPGSVQTDMMKGEGHFWISSPEKAATQIYNAIREKSSIRYVSKRWWIIGKILKNLPECLYTRLG